MTKRQERIGILVVEALKSRLTKEHGKFTGGLQSSIQYRVEDEFVIISMEDYAEYLEFGCFFDKNILINTKNGKKKLSKLKIGDLIWEGTCYKKLDKKIKFEINFPIDMININIEGKTISVTEEHPFYTNKGWKMAKDLIKSDKLYLLW